MAQGSRLLILTGAAAAFAATWVLTPVAKPIRALASPPPPAAASDVYYSGCNAVRAAGAAPLYRGQPGYREEMDGDEDGIACEPHRGGG